MYNDQLRIDERMRLRFITEIIEPLGMEPRPVRLQRFQIRQLEIQKSLVKTLYSLPLEAAISSTR
jgi:hypothetical protein